MAIIPKGKEPASINKSLIGKVEEIITCSEDEIPCNIEIKGQLNEIYFSPQTQSDEFLKNIIRADSAVKTEALISKSSVADFTPAAKSEVTAENIIWACCKGLSDEIVNVTGYLINKNNYTYGSKSPLIHTMKTAVKYLFVIRKADIRCLQINMKPATVI